LGRVCTFKITKILTDNGSQFTDRFKSKGMQPSGQHAFDLQCKAQGAEHRLAPPRHPQTNGMVERFNGRINAVVKQTRFTYAGELETTLTNYQNIYNHRIPQRALNHRSPIEALQNWRKKSPEIFVKRVYKQAELDISPKSWTYRSALMKIAALR
jgi:transposase InsO family protein